MANYRSLNQVTIVGRIGNFALKTGKVPFLTMSIATESSVKGEEGKWTTETEWHNVVQFGPSAERLEKALTKGTTVLVVGHLSTRKTEKGMYTSVIADQFQILGGGAKKDEAKKSAPAKPATTGGTAEDDCPF